MTLPREEGIPRLTAESEAGGRSALSPGAEREPVTERSQAGERKWSR